MMMLTRIFTISKICLGSSWSTRASTTAASTASLSVSSGAGTRLFSTNSPNDTRHYHSLQTSRLKDLLQSGQPLRGVVTGQYGDTDHIEMLGLIGYDFLWADAEHSSASPSDVARSIMAADCRGLPTLVRVGYGYQNTIGHIQKYLVAGAQGIILPQCESASDVQRVVEAVKFPPIGRRGLAGERWNAWGMAKTSNDESSSSSSSSSSDGNGITSPQRTLSIAECVQDANKNSIVGAMVETKRGLNALDDILDVPHLDFVFIAPTDLSADLNLHGQIRHPKVIELIEQAGQKIQDWNQRQREKGLDGDSSRHIAAGMLVLNEQDYIFWREREFQVLCGVAQVFFVDGARRLMESMDSYEHDKAGKSN